MSVSTSSEILPEIFEHERFSTTVANAVLSPLVGGYTRRLGERLAEAGYGGDLLLLHSGGGVMTPRAVERLAVRLAASGIAAGAIASRHIAEPVRLRERDRPRHGRHEHRHLARLRRRAAGDEGVVRRVRLPDLLPVDRGADDRRRRRLARLDRRGRLAAQRPAVGRRRSGPGRATGAEDTSPTNTDANLVLGRLGDELIGGAMTLDRTAAERAIRTKVGRAARARLRRRRERDHPGRERQHGRRRDG